MSKTLENYIEIITQNKTTILKEWLSDNRLKVIFEVYGINKHFFENHFGIRILDYFVGIIVGKTKPGDCPAMAVMLKFFAAKNIAISDIFHICDNFKKTLVLFFIRHDVKEQVVYEDLFNIIGENFANILEEELKLKCIQAQQMTFDSNEILTTTFNCSIANTNIKLQALSIEDKENISEIIDEISDYIGKFSMHPPTQANVIQFSDKIKKQAHMLITYGILDDLSNHLLKLSETINLHNAKFISTLGNILVLLDSFCCDMQSWINAVLDSGEDIDLQRSIIANISQICLTLNGGAGEEIEFFE